MRNDHLLITLTESISTLFGFIGSIKNDKIVWEKGLEEITIYDHIYHLSNCQENFYKRLETYITGQNPEIFSVPLGGIIKVHNPDMSQVSLMMRSFEKWRNSQIDLIRSTNGRLWDEKCIYSEFENYPFESCIKDIILNDKFHVDQINQILGWEKRVSL